MKYLVWLYFLVAGTTLVGCSAESDSNAGDAPDSAMVDMGIILADAGIPPDAGSPISLRAVPGALTYSATQGGETHI